MSAWAGFAGMEVVVTVKEKTQEVDNDDINNKDNSSNNVADVGVSEIVGKKKKKTSSFPCPSRGCPYVGATRARLRQHQLRHLDLRPHHCPVCERGFRTRAALNNHLNSHLQLKPYKCRHCARGFNSAGQRTRHERYIHTLEKRFACADCGARFVEATKLSRHRLLHSGARLHQCPHCTYAAADAFRLKRHIRTHTGEKPYECRVCRMRFIQQNSMKTHLEAQHSKEKKWFYCDVCLARVGRNSDLTKHKLAMHGANPVTCDVCRKSLPDRYTYRLHAVEHQGQERFRCSLCPFATRRRSQLDAHVTRRHFAAPDKEETGREGSHLFCPRCPKMFRYGRDLQKHLATCAGGRGGDGSGGERDSKADEGSKRRPRKSKREKRLLCGDCGKKYCNLASFQKHTAGHRRGERKEDGQEAVDISDTILDEEQERLLAMQREKEKGTRYLEVVEVNLETLVGYGPYDRTKTAARAAAVPKVMVVSGDRLGGLFQLGPGLESAAEVQGEDGGCTVVQFVNQRGEMLMGEAAASTCNSSANSNNSRSSSSSSSSAGSIDLPETTGSGERVSVDLQGFLGDEIGKLKLSPPPVRGSHS